MIQRWKNNLEQSGRLARNEVLSAEEISIMFKVSLSFWGVSHLGPQLISDTIYTVLVQLYVTYTPKGGWGSVKMGKNPIRPLVRMGFGQIIHFMFC